MGRPIKRKQQKSHGKHDGQVAMGDGNGHKRGSITGEKYECEHGTRFGLKLKSPRTVVSNHLMWSFWTDNV